MTSTLQFANSLLHHVPVGTWRKGIPLMMEFSVDPTTGPFLVSSTKSFVWAAPKGDVVRAAFRPFKGDFIDQEIVRAVQAMGVEAMWGNIFPLTADGVGSAIGHLLTYDIPSPEILASLDAVWDGIETRDVDGKPQRFFADCPIYSAAWLPPGSVVVVPHDRLFIGFIHVFNDQCVVVTHNTSRCLAICTVNP